MFQKAKRIIWQQLQRFAERKQWREVLQESRSEERLILRSVDTSCMDSLTQAEKEAYDRQWGWLGLPPSYREVEVFKHFNGFDPRYLSHYHYLPLIARRLNDYSWTKRFEYKALLGRFSNEVLRPPRTFAWALNGEWYDADFHQIPFEEAVRRCVAHDAFVCKPSAESGDGRGVKLLKRGGVNKEKWDATVSTILAQCSKDAVVQEVIRQSPEMAQFNPSSLNTLRVTSLYLNGRFSICSIILRMGKSGSVVDNWNAGGILLGVSLDGQLHEFGFDVAYNRFADVNGIRFAETRLACVPALLRLIEDAHTTRFSLCKLIGWDIAYEEGGRPVLIEVNSSQPGVFGEQFCTGPIFGDRTDEVIAYCRSKTFSYGRALASY